MGRFAAITAAFLAAAALQAHGEIRAVWEQSGKGLYPGDWAKTFRVLKANRVTDIFVSVAGPDFAHYASATLPRSRTQKTQGDQLAACLAAAHGSGVRVHAWVMCFHATRASPELLAEFGRKGWRLRNAKGEPTAYLNPANPDVRKRMLDALGEIAGRYPVDGIHLDFVRWYEGAAKPSDAAEKVASFVAGARRRVKERRAKAWLTAAVMGSATCGRSVGQEWGTWIDRGFVDYAVPMDYFAGSVQFAEALRRQAPRAGRTVCGLGVSAKESQLNRAQTLERVRQARKAGFAGVALFDLDDNLARKVLPGLF